MIALWACLGLAGGVFVNWVVEIVPLIRPQVQTSPEGAKARPRIYLWTALKNVWPVQSGHPQPFDPVKFYVELLLIVFFPLMFWFEGAGIELWQKTTLVTILVLIALIDLKYQLVLNPVLVGAGAVWVVFLMLQAQFAWLIWNAFLGGCVALVLFFLAGKVSRGRLGGGDIKLAFIIGFIFGYPHLFWPLLLGTTLGAVQGLGLLALSSKKNRLYAFAPALCLGAAIALFMPVQ